MADQATRRTRRKTIVGLRFTRLVVTGIESRDRVTAVCDCGELRSVTKSSLYNERSKSCGCLAREMYGKTHRTHGLSKSPEYVVWNHMRDRCSNQNNPAFCHYGGRGISVADRWNSFENFFADMGPKPSPRHSIDRINVNGNYEPGNCRWATPIEQGRNKRNTIVLTHGDRTMTMTEWAVELGISRQALHQRVLSWGPKEALARSFSGAAE